MKATFLSSHRGYRLTASACPTHGGLLAANLIIEKPGRKSETFAALDYFFDDELALQYATHWGRIWVDSRSTETS